MFDTLINVLREQKQCDEDGTFCIVSRQAVDEAIAALQNKAPPAAVDGLHRRRPGH